MFSYDKCCKNIRVECLDLDAKCRNDYSIFMYNQTFVNDISRRSLEKAFKLNSDVANNVADWDEIRCVKSLNIQCKDHVDKACWKQPEQKLDKCFNLMDSSLACPKAPEKCI